MKIKFYLTLIVTTLTISAQCFSMTVIEGQGEARRKLFNKRTSADYSQVINDHTNAINNVLSDVSRVSATPATPNQKETILKTVIEGALTV